MRGFSERSISIIRQIADARPRGNVLVFTHGGVLDMLYRSIAGLAISAQRDFGIPNAGLNRIEITPAGWRIRAWADIAHLESALDDLSE